MSVSSTDPVMGLFVQSMSKSIYSIYILYKSIYEHLNVNFKAEKVLKLILQTHGYHRHLWLFAHKFIDVNGKIVLIKV